MKFLHLSDLHYHPEDDGRTNREIRSTMEEFFKKNIEVDHLFITGDFRHGKYTTNETYKEEENAEGVGKYINKIAEAVGITDKSHIHLIPGNHDINKTKDIKTLNQIINNYDTLSGNISDENKQFLLQRHNFFHLVVKEVCGENSVWEKEENMLHTYAIFDEFAVLYLNTALTYNADDDDMGGKNGKLILCNDDISSCLEEIKEHAPNKPIIIIAHHGIDYLREDEQHVMEVFFKGFPVKAYLCGDAHVPWQTERNQVVEITMGSIKHEKGVYTVGKGKNKVNRPHESETVFIIGELEGNDLLPFTAYRYIGTFGGGTDAWQPYEQYNAAINQGIKKKEIAKITTLGIPMQPSLFFRGRDTKESDILNILEKEKTLLLLNGLGGVGKTEICRSLFWRATTNGIIGIKKIAWIFFQEDLSASFMNNFKEITAETKKDYFIMVQEYLRQQNQNFLLIIDNLNHISQQDIVVLRSLPCKILLTSRKKINQIKSLEVGTLSEEDCILLYYDVLEDDKLLTEEETDVIRQIVTLANCHTLAVELLAKTQKASRKGSCDFLESLREIGFTLKGITEKVSSNYNMDVAELEQLDQIFIEHMAKVFDLAQIGEKELPILQCFSLFSPQIMEANTAKELLQLEDFNRINYLVDIGWISEDTQNSLYMHSIIASVVAYKSNVLYAAVEFFINALADELALENTDIYTVKLPLFTIGKAVLQKISSKELSYSQLLMNVARISYESGDYPTALQFYNDSLAIRETVLGKEHPSTATTYNNIAGTYESMGDYPTALQFYNDSLAIREKVLGKEHPSTAATYNNIAGVYSDMGDYPTALQFYKKDLQISEKVLGKEHPSTATTYNNIAGTYESMGDYPTALQFYNDALAIREKVLGKEHPSTATTYNNIGLTYGSMGDYPTALQFYNDSLAIRETVLGKEHPSTATTYNNIAGVYKGMGDYPTALQFYNDSLAIREKVLGKEHPSTATTYNNIAGVYRGMGDYPTALQFYKKDLQISEKVLGKEHPSTATTYNNIAIVYIEMGDIDKAKDYFVKGNADQETIDIFVHLGEIMKETGMKNLKEVIEFLNNKD